MTQLWWSLQALRDLEAIREYIAVDSPRYAGLVVERIIAAVERLRAFPESGRLVPERSDPQIREVSSGPIASCLGIVRRRRRLRNLYRRQLRDRGAPGCAGGRLDRAGRWRACSGVARRSGSQGGGAPASSFHAHDTLLRVQQPPNKRVEVACSRRANTTVGEPGIDDCPVWSSSASLLRRLGQLEKSGWVRGYLMNSVARRRA